jgi:hypothetical protein
LRRSVRDGRPERAGARVGICEKTTRVEAAGSCHERSALVSKKGQHGVKERNIDAGGVDLLAALRNSFGKLPVVDVSTLWEPGLKFTREIPEAFYELISMNPSNSASTEDDEWLVESAAGIFEFLVTVITHGDSSDRNIVRNIYNMLYEPDMLVAHAIRIVTIAIDLFRENTKHLMIQIPLFPLSLDSPPTPWPAHETEAVVYAVSNLTRLDKNFANLKDELGFLYERMKKAAHAKPKGRGQDGPVRVTAALAVKAGALGCTKQEDEKRFKAEEDRITNQFAKIKADKMKGRKVLPAVIMNQSSSAMPFGRARR